MTVISLPLERTDLVHLSQHTTLFFVWSPKLNRVHRGIKQNKKKKKKKKKKDPGVYSYFIVCLGHSCVLLSEYS